MPHVLSPQRLLLVGLTLLLWSALPAHALTFETLQPAGGAKVLLIRDCGRGRIPRDYDEKGKSICEEWTSGFAGEGEYDTKDGKKVQYRGDLAVLESVLRGGGAESYAEVWFFSGGGDLQSGVEMGRRLRAYKMTVRVPNRLRLGKATGWQLSQEVFCVSSCTVAFMGGFFRYMDDGATYQVHSASAVSGDIGKDTLELLKQGDFAEIAKKQQMRARFRGRQLLTHFQNSLLQFVRTPQRPENDDAFIEWAQYSRARVPYSDAQLEADRARLFSEGAGIAQDIVMRIERDAMGWAISDLRAMLPELGPRAEPALKMLEAMYDVGILDTQTLSRQTMLRMGYLTQDVALN